MRERDDLEVEIPAGSSHVRRTGRTWWAALGASLVAFAVLAQGHGSAARAARLDGVETAPSLAAPWHVAWTDPGTVLAVDRRTVVLSGPDGTGAIARDASGAVVWGPVRAGSPCAPAPGAILCRTISATGSAGTVTAGGDRQEAVALDAAGHVSATYRPPGALSSWWFLDGTLLAVAQEQGHLVVDRWAPEGFVWRYRSSDAVVAPVAYPFSIEQGDGWLLVGGTRAVLLDLTTGQEIRTKPAARRATDRATPTFAFRDRSLPGLRLTQDGEDVRGAVDGGRPWRVPGPLRVLVDGVVVAGGVTAVDARSGATLWSAPGDGAFCDGDLVAVVGDGELTARRARDGTVVWRIAVSGHLAGVTADGVVVAGEQVSFLAP